MGPQHPLLTLWAGLVGSGEHLFTLTPVTQLSAQPRSMETACFFFLSELSIKLKGPPVWCVTDGRWGGPPQHTHTHAQPFICRPKEPHTSLLLHLQIA